MRLLRAAIAPDPIERKFLARRLDGDARVVLVPPALPCQSPGVAKPSLWILMNCFDEQAVVISLEIHADFLELGRRSLLQALAPRALGKMKEFLMPTPLLLRVPLIISCEDPPALVPRVRKLLFMARGISAGVPRASTPPSGESLRISRSEGAVMFPRISGGSRAKSFCTRACLNSFRDRD
jgi:hypothetical protein